MVRGLKSSDVRKKYFSAFKSFKKLLKDIKFHSHYVSARNKISWGEKKKQASVFEYYPTGIQYLANSFFGANALVYSCLATIAKLKF